MNSLHFKLSVMMFLEFFIWGCWLPPSFGFFDKQALNFSEWEQILLNIAFPISAIVAMFFANQFVDRVFAAEKFLALSHFIGGLALLGFGALSWMTFQSAEAVRPNYWLFFACMAIHCLFYVPTISVTNTIAFANLKDAQKEFGPVRLWGTIGWIAASWPFIFILVDWTQVDVLYKKLATQDATFVNWLGLAFGTSLSGAALNQGKCWAFLVAGMASIALAAFSLNLPHTPPKQVKAGENQFAWLEAMKLLKHPFLLVLFIVTFIDATVHDGFFVFAFDYLAANGVSQNWVQPAMSIGQLAEIGTMAFLGYVLKTFGWRTTMIVGVLGHAIRFAVFAFVQHNAWAAVSVNILHGICYAFFFATLYIFVDECFPKDARTSAQGLFNFLILGLGPIIGRSIIWPALKAVYSVPHIVNGVPEIKDGKPVLDLVYNPLLLYPSGAAIFAALLLLFFFHPPAKPVPESVGH